MNPEVTTTSFILFLEFIKEYWFLITLGLSLLATVFYAVVYRVNPFGTYRDISYRNVQIKFYNELGQSFLEQGHYEMAKAEFEKALSLKATNYAALHGRYVSELFIAIDLPKWDPSIGLVVRDRLQELGLMKHRPLLHIIEKYLGDLHQRTNDISIAEQHYERALAIKYNYPDALETFAWFFYFKDSHGDENIKRMTELFTAMTMNYPYDYRGFHGLGYALYMHAIKNSTQENSGKLILDAANQAQRASSLKINLINVVGDFGEIARTVDPQLSIWYHQWGLDLMADPEVMGLTINRGPLAMQLLKKEARVTIITKDQKRSWLTYQLALDYLALGRRGLEGDQKNIDEHDRLFKEAKAMDQKGDIITVYEDQLSILDALLPGENA
ncbi:hypothetical protein MNBD_DELTA01-1524 [hydrothermal vent metagenome]|uniref:Uncharacterized protein n=1 Tax=hydrothermal vent metagenome TaxID=652676 RepID=A0A3B0R5Z8_9ZZZZ